MGGGQWQIQAAAPSCSSWRIWVSVLISSHANLLSPFPDKRGWSWQARQGSGSHETGVPIALGWRLSLSRAPASSGPPCSLHHSDKTPSLLSPLAAVWDEMSQVKCGLPLKHFPRVPPPPPLSPSLQSTAHSAVPPREPHPVGADDSPAVAWQSSPGWHCGLTTMRFMAFSHWLKGCSGLWDSVGPSQCSGCRGSHVLLSEGSRTWRGSVSSSSSRL